MEDLFALKRALCEKLGRTVQVEEMEGKFSVVFMDRGHVCSLLVAMEEMGWSLVTVDGLRVFFRRSV